MNVIVCVKQVPGTTAVRIDPETHALIREGVAAVLNPCDLHALEEGLRIRDREAGKLTLLSMGIPEVARLLRKALGLGADEAVLLSDRAFAGADTLATAYVLAQGVRKLGPFDLILCGRQAIDGDTAQVGPSLAERLAIPHTTDVQRIEEIRAGYLRCRRVTEGGYETLEMTLPAVVTVVRQINEPRIPSIPGLIRARRAKLRLWTAGEIDADRDRCGARGSATQVLRTFAPLYDAGGERIEGVPAEQARRLADRLLTLPCMIGR